MKSIHLILPTSLAALALAPNDSPVSTLDVRGESRPADPAALSSSSLAWSDVDGDGLVDVLALQPDGAATALKNAGGGRFEAFSDAVGLGSLPLLRNASWQDFDADGKTDLLFVSLQGELDLLRNEGGAFTPVALSAGLPVQGVLDARWADDDADGLADLIVFSDAGYAFYHNVGQGLFEAGDRVAAGPQLPETTPMTGGTLGEVASVPTPTKAPAPETSPKTTAGGLEAPDRVPFSGREEVIVNETDPGPATPLGPFGEVSFCAPSIVDTSSGSCVSAASDPQLGMLYPLSTDLNVDGDGDVGVGTTSPAAKLHVVGQGQTGVIAFSDSVGASITTTTASALTPALRIKSGTGDLASFMDGALQVGQTGGAPFFLDQPRLKLRTGSSGNGVFEMLDGDANLTFSVDTDFSSGSRVTLRRDTGNRGVDMYGGLGTSGGFLGVYQENGIETVQVLGSEVAGNGAQLTMRTFAGVRTFEVDAQGGSVGAVMDLYTAGGTNTVKLRAEQAVGAGSDLVMRKGNGTLSVVLDAEDGGSGELGMYSANGTKTVELVGEEIAGQGGQLVLRKADGTATITLDAEFGGDGYITTDVLQITGGADLVESFDTAEDAIEPGSVLVIDPANPGGLRLSDGAYDRRVAGVVSGANGVQPGLRLGQDGVLDGDTPVALTGRVYVKCTTENGPIEAGDLLTSSSTPGHAMRASDPERAFGAVLGKALTTLEGEETGLVLVLVGLQ